MYLHMLQSRGTPFLVPWSFLDLPAPLFSLVFLSGCVSFVRMLGFALSDHSVFHILVGLLHCTTTLQN